MKSSNNPAKEFIRNLESKRGVKFNDDKDEKHLAQMLMYRFLSEIEKLMEQNKMSRKDLAARIHTSPSYLTQVYRGNKPLNFSTLAKIESALDVRFEVSCVEKSLIEMNEVVESSWDEDQINNFIGKFKCSAGLWMYKRKSSYSKFESNQEDVIPTKNGSHHLNLQIA